MFKLASWMAMQKSNSAVSFFRHGAVFLIKGYIAGYPVSGTACSLAKRATSTLPGA
jgi:hypothetical protein